MMRTPKLRRNNKLVWYYCNGGCGTVLVDELRVAGCGSSSCTGPMCYLEMTEKEYGKYKPLLEELGVQGFVKSLPPQRPLRCRKDLIKKWERDAGV